MSTKNALDGATFERTYQAEVGEAPRVTPATLDELFDRLSDPDNFSSATAAMLRAAKASVSDASTSDGPLSCHAGDVYVGRQEVAGNLAIQRHTLVLGDLVVDGVLSIEPAHRLLLVAGTLRCRALQSVRGYLYVAGDAEVEEMACVTTYGQAWVEKKWKTPLFVFDGSVSNHPFDDDDDDGDDDVYVGNVEGARVNLEDDDARERLEPLLAEGLLGDADDDVTEKVFDLFDALGAGERVLAPRG